MTLYLAFNTTRDKVWHIWNKDFETEHAIHFEALCGTPNIADMWVMTRRKKDITNHGRLCLKCEKIKEFQEREQMLDEISF